jgi:hypothetical protein
MIKYFFKTINLLYPVTCFLCGKDLTAISKYKICDECKKSFNKIRNDICQKKCDVDLGDGGNLCCTCRKIYKYMALTNKISLFI